MSKIFTFLNLQTSLGKAIMILMLLPVFTTQAQTGTPNTTWYTSNPSAATFNISTADQLAGLAQLVNNNTSNFSGKTVNLTANIDLSAYQSGTGWSSIGNASNRFFSGTFDGTGKTISGLYINDPTRQYCGLFGNADGGTIKNVTVKDVDIYGYVYVGAVVGRNGIVENCHSSGLVRGTSNYVGGIIGRQEYQTGIPNIVKDCSSSCVVIGGGNNIGGIAGWAYKLERCFFTGSVNGEDNVGGIAGTISGPAATWAINCYSTGNVTGSGGAGGIAGQTEYSYIENCYSAGTIHGYIAGGIVAFMTSYQGNGSYGSVLTCYSIASISRITNGCIGGIVGSKEGGNIQGCAALNSRVAGGGRVYCTNTTGLTGNMGFDNMLNGACNTTWTKKGDTNGDGADISAAQIISDGTIGSRFVIGGGWTTQNGKLPGLLGQTVAIPPHIIAPGTMIIAAPINGIASPAPGNTPATTITATSQYTGTVAWSPADNPFDYNTTYKATITLTAASGYTFICGFGNTSEISGFTVNGIVPSEYVSNNGTTLVFKVTFPKTPAIAGFCGGTGTITDPLLICTAQQLDLVRNYRHKHFKLSGNININSYINSNYAVVGWLPIGDNANRFTGTFDGGGYVISGLWINRNASDIGLFGVIGAGGTVKNLGVEIAPAGVIGKTNTGGLTGTSISTIQECYVSGNVQGTISTGNLVGYAGGGTITNCYATGNATGTDAVGGLIGQTYYATVSCCYSTGAVTGTQYVGGFIGMRTATTASGCYFNNQTSLQTSGVGTGVQTSVNPKTTAQMKQKATFTAWGFTNVWGICENYSFPHLQWQKVACPVITVATQTGTITAGTAGSATFAVTTANIANGAVGTITWFTAANGLTVGSVPTGITPSISNVATNAATVTMNANTGTVAGTYYFKVTINGVVSNVATLTVSSPVFVKTISVATQTGAIIAGTAGVATFAVTTANIANGVAGTITWFTAADGLTTGSVPTGIAPSVSNVLTNAATVTMTADNTAVAGNYYFKVTIDGVTSDVVTLTVDVFSGIWINATNFPDDNFRNYLLAQPYGSDALLTQAEIDAITSMYIAGLYISDLSGIGFFTALESLNCSDNLLTTVDISANTALQYFYCHYNQLTALDLSANTALEFLYCNNNELTALDVSTNTMLINLQCYYNHLTAIDLTGLSDLNTFIGTFQTTELTLTYTGSDFSVAIDLNNPTDLAAGLTYGSSTLTSTSSSIAFSPFTVETNHPYFTLSGTLMLAYEGMPVKTISVAAQNGALAAGTAGSATFDVTTENIADDEAGTIEWFTAADGMTTGSVPTGITTSISNVLTNAANITMTANNTTIAGIYYFKVTIDGVTSDIATLTILNRYNITVTANPIAGGTVSGGNIYTHGTTVTVIATPNTGYNFVNWTNAGTEVSTSTNYNFAATENVDLVANFTLKTYTITASAGANGTITPIGKQTLIYGDNITFTFAPNTGFEVEKLLIDGISVPDSILSGSYTFNNITGNHTIEVHFFFSCPNNILYQGYNYKVTALAGLCWTENMRNKKYADDTPIPYAKPYFHSQHTDTTQNTADFGLLYTWDSAMGVPLSVQGICPNGWRIPITAEWLSLNMYDMNALRNPDFWLTPNNNTNSTGFGLCGSSFYNSDTQRFEDLYGYSVYWSSDISVSTTTCKGACTRYYCPLIEIIDIKKTDAVSVRCVME